MDRQSNHPLDLYRDQGGVTLADLAAADAEEPQRLADGTTINPLIWAAAGTHDEQRALSDAQRAETARRIESSVAQYDSWTRTRPVAEQAELRARPVIGLGPVSDDDDGND